MLIKPAFYPALLFTNLYGLSLLHRVGCRHWGLRDEQDSSCPPGAQTGWVVGVGRTVQCDSRSEESLDTQMEKHPSLGMGKVRKVNVIKGLVQ